MRLTAVIRALNEEEHIGRLLTGLARQRRPVDEVVLVDSGSSDATVEIARRFGARIVHIDPDEFSFGRSLNRGLKEANGDVAIIPSAHVYPVHDAWTHELVAPFADARTALTYGRQVGGDVTKFSEHRVLAQWFPPESDLDQQHPFCNNANAAVRLDVWRQHGYDESLTGLEDLDFARRVLSDGWRIAYVAPAVVVHVHDESWAQIRNRYRREAIAHRRIFDAHHVSLAETAQLIAQHVARDALAAVRTSHSPRTLAAIIRFRVAQFAGTYRGFRQSGPIDRDLKRRFYYPDRAGQSPSPDVEFGPGSPIDYSQDENPP